jgi:CheY-like chemotaxis protein
MKITCEACQKGITIPDDKIPPGKTASLTCPHCKHKISVSAPPKADVDISQIDSLEEFFSFDDQASQDDYDSAEKPFDFVEEEGKTALLCEPDPALREKIREVLEVLEYHITVPENGREALKQMRYHAYDLMVLNEHFDTNNPDVNGILIYLERLNMSIRRNIFVALITQRFRTMDHMAAFQKSVNMIVNMSNIDDFDKILRRGLADSDLFYRVIKEMVAQR